MVDAEILSMMNTRSILTQTIAQEDFTAFSHLRPYMGLCNMTVGQLSVVHYAMNVMCLQYKF
jgi:hypothetical protein